MLVPPKQVSFLTISNENIFLKTQGTRLGAIVTPNKGLEKALIASLLYCAIIHRSIAYMCYTQNRLFETPGFKRILPQNKLVLIELISRSLVTHIVNQQRVNLFILISLNVCCHFSLLNVKFLLMEHCSFGRVDLVGSSTSTQSDHILV